MSKHRTHGTIRHRLLSGLLCLALALGLLPAGPVLPARAASWADPYAQQLVGWGIMRGDIDGNLNLENNITRAEFVTMLNRAFGYSKLGGTPFTDVPSRAWYAEDIDIAYNAGYFKGMTNNTAAPESPLTREQAAVLLARNLMLRETTGESLGFSDSRILNEWSRGLIGAAVEEGMITGYTDGTFRPFNNITRGEVSAMLVRAIGTPISATGNRSLGDVYGNVLINRSNVTLRNTTIAGNLYLTGGIDLGNVLLENVTVLGRIVVGGGGESNASQSSVVLRNVEADEMVVDSIRNQFVTIRALGVTDIPLTSVRTGAYLDDSSSPGYGLHRIELDGESGTKLQLAGSVKEVVNLTPDSDLQLVQGSAQKITIDEYATNSRMLVALGTRVDELNLDVATQVNGEGDISDLNVGAANCDVKILPDSIVIRPGITATVNGEVMGSVDAAELSSAPRLMAGYPTVTNIAPTTAEGLYSANKPGTIYWAISAVTDGSVSEGDLISNPAYGGNIYAKQAGSISVSNVKAEYARGIKDLLSDGSYYISAILVDGRGDRSPVKVAAFSTPDDTKPAFVGTPAMTRITTTVAQATVTANKNCQLYWALLPAQASAPTPQQFKTGSVGSNYGYGTLSVVKNAPISLTVNTMRLREKTEYWLYLWLTDYNGAQSMAAPVQVKFATPDETPPIVTAPIQTGWYESSLDVTFSINEAPSILYWSIVAEGNETFITPGANAEETAGILSDLRTKIKVESGTGAIAHGSSNAATANADILFTVAGLDTAKTGTNNYTLYYVGKDASGNYSERVGSVSVQTLDTTPPTVKYEFTRYNGDKTDEPMADSGVRLVFSEQVKGGSNASKTFLDLYHEAMDTSLDADTRAEARNTLAKELAAHIRLYSVPRTGQPVQVTPRGDGDTGNNWVLDFHNAVITMESNGSLVVFLPGTADEGYSPALQLDSGATYYFQLLSVFDNSEMHPNGVSNTGNENPTGNLTMGMFTTVYAQITMRRNTNIDEVSNGEHTGTRLDICFDLIPTSTKKVPDTERWDLIMWSNTSVALELYRQVDDGPWELVNANGAASRIDITAGQTTSAIGMGYTIQGNTNSSDPDSTGSYAVVQNTLKEEHTYHYGIHFTRVNDTEEDDREAEPERWSELVTMEFSLIAGSRGDVADVSNRPTQNYDAYIQRGDVAPIGNVYTTSGVTKILSVSKQFTDTKVPEFYPGYPKITPGSGTIHMELSLDRPGTIYYVVAPVGGIPTSLAVNGVSTPINASNDGTTVDTDESIKTPAQKLEAVKELTDNGKSPTYIPTDGNDRDTYSPYIAFTSNSATNKEAQKFTAPTYRQITNPSFGASSNVYVSDPIEYSGATVEVDIPGRLPLTEYYIYFVRQGGGLPDEVVEVYRTTTTDVKVPVVTVTGTSTTATMTPNEDSQLCFALVEYNSLPDFIRGNVLTQMMTRPDGTNGHSAFDRNTDEALKLRVANYVLGNTGSSTGTGTAPVGTWKLPDGQQYKDPISAGQSVVWPFENYMTSPASEYVVLVIARHTYGGETGNDYGFGAVRSLYTPDKVPPEYVGGAPYLRASITRCTNPDDRNDWSTTPEKWGYTGSVSIPFSKDIYFHDSSSSQNYEVWSATPTADADKLKAKGLAELVTGTAVDNNRIRFASTGGRIGSSITLNFNNLRAGDTIIIFGSGRISNRSDYTANFTLELTFEPTLVSTDYNTGNIVDDSRVPYAAPGFVVNLRQIGGGRN